MSDVGEWGDASSEVAEWRDAARDVAEGRDAARDVRAVADDVIVFRRRGEREFISSLVRT